MEKRRTEIDGHTYEITLFGAKEGQRVFFRLVQFLGPLIGVAAGADGSLDKRLGPALETFARTATPEQFEGLIDCFVDKTVWIQKAETKTGIREIPTKLGSVYDSHFALRYQAAFLWLGWAAKENFESFLGSKGSGTLLDLLGLKRVSKSDAPRESTGSFGDQESAPT